MKSNFVIVIIILLLPILIYSQNKQLNNNISNTDSLKVQNKLELPKSLRFFNNGLYYLNNSFYENIQYNPEIDGNLWLKTFEQINSISSNNYIHQLTMKNMLAPLRLQYLDSQKFSFLRQVLSTAQLTAVGIMAYEHIKKYGFIKRK